jgi:hypothetical protein
VQQLWEWPNKKAASIFYAFKAGAVLIKLFNFFGVMLLVVAKSII